MDNSIYEENYLEEIIEKIDEENVPDKQIVELIYELANSGKRIYFSTQVFDFASTGGPSSLTTILVPLYLYAMGAGVINLAVQGRPAGAVDVLSQIEGYDLENFNRNMKLEAPFYIHLEAGHCWVPLDKALFEYRKRIGKVNVPNLAIASILAKKVASGANNIGLDVRVSEFGNFGSTWEECVANAKKYNRLANLMGMRSTCFLSNANSPYQKYIGRGEALEALYDIFEERADDSLNRHVQYCEKIARMLINKADMTLKTNAINLKQSFINNLIFQGSNYDNFIKAVQRIKEQPRTIIYAGEEGYLQYNLKEIRNYIVLCQEIIMGEFKYADPCGVILLCETGTFVEKDTPILSVRNFIVDNIVQINRMYSIHKNQIIVEAQDEVI